MFKGRVVRMSVLMLLACVAVVRGAETFTAMATLKTAGGTTASTPVSITIDRITPQAEADALAAAFSAGGAAGLRKALEGKPATGSVRVGGGAAKPTRLTMERTTDKGRLLTILTDTPLFFVGAGAPGARPGSGYDFALLDLEIGSDGAGSGTLAPAARIKLTQGAFVVEDYGTDVVRLVVRPTR
jgi:hypothetical protein